MMRLIRVAVLGLLLALCVQAAWPRDDDEPGPTPVLGFFMCCCTPLGPTPCCSGTTLPTTVTATLTSTNCPAGGGSTSNPASYSGPGGGADWSYSTGAVSGLSASVTCFQFGGGNVFGGSGAYGPYSPAKACGSCAMDTFGTVSFDLVSCDPFHLIMHISEYSPDAPCGTYIGSNTIEFTE